MRLLLGLFLLSLFLGFVGRGWYELKGGFSFRRLQGPFLAVRKEDPPLCSEAKEAFRQNFYYLKGGRQCYAFLSQDGKYVLKFPRLDRCRRRFEPGASFERQERRRTRLYQLNLSFQIADEDLKEAAQIIYSHLGLQAIELPVVRLADSLGQTMHLDLNHYVFVLQRYMGSWIREFEAGIKKGDQEKVQALLKGYLEWVAFRAKKGVFDKDPAFQPNLGLKESRVAQIDLATFYRKEGMSQQEAFRQSFHEATLRMSDWLSVRAPLFQDWFQKQVELCGENGVF